MTGADLSQKQCGLGGSVGRGELEVCGAGVDKSFQIPVGVGVGLKFAGVGRERAKNFNPCRTQRYYTFKLLLI